MRTPVQIIEDRIKELDDILTHCTTVIEKERSQGQFADRDWIKSLSNRLKYLSIRKDELNLILMLISEELSDSNS